MEIKEVFTSDEAGFPSEGLAVLANIIAEMILTDIQQNHSNLLEKKECVNAS